MTFRSFCNVSVSRFSVFCAIAWLAIPISVYSQDASPVLSQENYYIKSVFFGGGSYQIDPDQRQEVVDFILSIEDLREYEIILHGHTDNIGSKDFNQWLSEMRSAEVLDILSELSMDRAGIEVHDFGEESPYYSNQTWNGKLSNRRVDVIIQKIVM